MFLLGLVAFSSPQNKVLALDLVYSHGIYCKHNLYASKHIFLLEPEKAWREVVWCSKYKQNVGKCKQGKQISVGWKSFQGLRRKSWKSVKKWALETKRNPETGTMTVFVDLSTRGQDQLKKNTLQKDAHTEGSISSYCTSLIHCYMVAEMYLYDYRLYIHIWTPLACTTSLQPQLGMSTQKKKRHLNGQQFSIINKIKPVLDTVSFVVRKNIWSQTPERIWVYF